MQTSQTPSRTPVKLEHFSSLAWDELKRSIDYEELPDPSHVLSEFKKEIELQDIPTEVRIVTKRGLFRTEATVMPFVRDIEVLPNLSAKKDFWRICSLWHLEPGKSNVMFPKFNIAFLPGIDYLMDRGATTMDVHRYELDPIIQRVEEVRRSFMKTIAVSSHDIVNSSKLSNVIKDFTCQNRLGEFENHNLFYFRTFAEYNDIVTKLSEINTTLNSDISKISGPQVTT